MFILIFNLTFLNRIAQKIIACIAFHQVQLKYSQKIQIKYSQKIETQTQESWTEFRCVYCAQSLRN